MSDDDLELEIEEIELSRPRDGGGFIAGLLTGALIGAAIAMLLAPQTGDETRDLLRKKGGDAAVKAREAAEYARKAAEQARDIADKAREAADRAREDAVELGGTLYARGKKIVDEARSDAAHTEHAATPAEEA